MPDPVLHACTIDAAGRQQIVGDAEVRVPWWSFTKTVIAVCALRLAETGALTLDEPIGSGETHDGPRSYTLRQALQHRAGVPDYGANASYHADVARDAPAWSRARLLAEVPANRLLFAPGAGWAYSNIGTMFARETLEARAGEPLDALIDGLVCRPLGLDGVVLARSRADFSGICWTEAARYDPGWVYHGCLVGTPRAAAVILDAVFRGTLLSPKSKAELVAATDLGGPVAGRPWTKAGYGLGLMAGEMSGMGRALGHSGEGPFSVNAVYHCPDLRGAPTVACFAHGTDVSIPERAVARLAVQYSSAP